ncbi:MAG: polyphosphate kinase 1 [Bacteroidetes bacterium]|nr:polyphosphate kinase 1 [Bacteroidota bacterium]
MTKISLKEYTNREISWLHFNERVLQEAVDESTPLIERARFLGIFSNNRDEFFRVRVATLRRLVKYEAKHEIEDTNTEALLEEITEIVNAQEKRFTDAYKKLLVDLEKNNIYFLNEKNISKEQGEYLRTYFNEEVRSFLFPIMLKRFKKLDSLKDDQFYLAIDLQKDDVSDYALVQVPIGEVPRFIELPSEGDKHFLMMLDDVIRYCLDDVFSIFGYTKFEAYTIKFTRDAELDIDNDVSKSFLEIMSESIKQRTKGEPVRFVYDEETPEELLQTLIKKFSITKRDQTRAGGRYHNMKDFMSFPKVGKKKLSYPPMPPLPHPELKTSRSILDVIREKDVMLHFPYQSFQYIVDLLREASIDPQVRSIKMTFYRAARESKVMNALINAARNGKYVTVFMELQARFDEKANIYWTEKLQAEGVRIIQTIPNYKVHSKLILIRRKEDGGNVYYANISTGNFNESTAKVYADDSLLTSNQDIAKEVNEVFHLFESKFTIPTFDHLIVAPFRIRDFFLEKLDQEIKNAEEGKDAWAVLKMNSLVDKKIVRKLYKASIAGVKITLIVRGICVLKSGEPIISENINAFSIVDKYLEHSRVYVFGNDGNPEYYISSADWMQRNFDHRVEVLCPIRDKAIQKELWDMLEIQMKDNVKARHLNLNDLSTYKKTNEAVKSRSQFEIYEYFKQKVN